MGYGEIFKYKIYYVCIYSSIPITYPHTHTYMYMHADQGEGEDLRFSEMQLESFQC